MRSKWLLVVSLVCGILYLSTQTSSASEAAKGPTPHPESLDTKAGDAGLKKNSTSAAALQAINQSGFAILMTILSVIPLL